MATYTPDKIVVATGLDEIGLRLGLQRLPGEELGQYRRRLYLEAMDPSGPSQADYIRTLGRKVGEFDIPVFEIDLVLSSGVPLAPDPFIEVTSTHLRAYSDLENDTIDFEINFLDRSDGYFLRDVKAAFDASTYFTCTVLDTDYTYRKSDHLRFGDTEGLVLSEGLSPSRMNRLAQEYITNIWFTDPLVFQTLVGSESAVDEQGEYYVDEQNGVVFTNDPARGYCSYSYRVFPYKLFWQPVRAWPLNDADSAYLRYNTVISDDTGSSEYTLLNSTGAEIANEVLAIHPLGWGE